MRVGGRRSVVRNEEVEEKSGEARPPCGEARQGMTKRLTFTEGRLRLSSQKTLPDLEVRRLGSRGEYRLRRP